MQLSLSGQLRYKAGSRLQALRRDLVVLNPLNPFDRTVRTEQCIGELRPAQWRTSVRRVQTALASSNRLSLIGSAYLGLLMGIALTSLTLYFGHVLLALAIAHLCSWGLATWELVRSRHSLQLSSSRTFGLAFEALLVPGYLVNLGKRVWFRQTLPLAAFTVGLRQLKRMAKGDSQELYLAQMAQRLDNIAFELGLDEEPTATAVAGAPAELAAPKPAPSSKPPVPSALRTWLHETKTCLTISAPPTGL